VVVDTGSTDRTVEIARSFGADVFEFAWIDDFAAARNEALPHATGDYAFWLDADDVVDPPQRLKLIALLASLGGQATCADGEVGPDLPGSSEHVNATSPHGRRWPEGPDEGAKPRSERLATAHRNGIAAYVVRCACDPSPDGTGGDTVVDHIRLFPIRDDVRFTYRVHDQVLPSINRAKIPVRWTDLTIRHTGYVDKALRSRKLDRDSRILERELQERPDEPFVLFNLGSIAVERQVWPAALGYLKRKPGPVGANRLDRAQALCADRAGLPDDGRNAGGAPDVCRGAKARPGRCRIVVSQGGGSPVSR
jgi:glycosyltransferase involved in cell wall biosynthesis